jgi:hypothetical protein
LEESISIAKLDYFIRNDRRNDGKIGQYLIGKKKMIVSDRIKYHGGYSKILYKEWNGYVSKGRRLLE